RRFYDMNVAQLFTEKSGVRFRAIFVSAKQKAGREAALKTAEELLQRARAGEDFAKLATDYNDDPTRRDNQGWWMVNKREEGEQTITEPAWIERGSLAQRFEAVEKAAYALNVGEATPAPIDVGDGFYIVKLEQKQNGHVRPFDNPQVQEEIGRRLGADQRRALRDKEYMKLARQSVVRQDEEKIQTTVDMAMQKYFAWSRANGLTRANPEPVGGTSR